MSLGPGTKLGPYEILALIGAGGMGEVYRASDTRLGRDVAIKVSAVDFGARFEREARAVAALNHPHICTLHDVGPNYLVMELIAGETLAERLRAGALPPPEALRIGVQIGEALEAAHEKGIVHRDLKPGNIKVKPDGGVKVLDFGLAKEVAGPQAVSNSPTFTVGATEAGLILGTAAYMSPEQARGKPVDKRTDIWAFGCVLFEMLTGKQAFEGETLTDVLAAIMKNEPDWTALPAETPRPVRSLIRRCLQKDPGKRVHDIADARIEIDEALGAPETPAASVTAARRRRGWPTIAPWVLTALFAAVAAWLTFADRILGPGSVPLPLHVELSLPPGVESYVGSSPSSVAFSPDGTRVAFVGILEGKRQAYIRRLDQFEATPVKDTDLAASLNFSPNGRSLVAVLTNRTLKTLSLDDGLSLTLSKDVDYTAGAVWGPDDRITFGRNNALWQLPASGGEPTELTKLDTAKGELLHTHPALTADGRTLLFSVVTGSSRTNHIEALPLAPGGDRRVVLESGSSPLHMSSGHLLFLRSGALLAVPVEDGTLRVRGAPVRVVDEVRLSTLGSAMITAVSHTGSLAFMNGAIGSQLVWTSRQGGEERITGADRPYASPAVSPLTSRRLVASWNGDVWILDGDRAMKLTSDATSGNSYPVWTPDGKRVIFRTRTGMYWVDAEGSGQLEAIPESSINDYPNSVSPDGQWLAFLRISGETGGDVYVVSLRGDAKPRPLVATPAYEGGAQFSPDGRWVAFASDESGHYQVFVRPFTGENRKWLVSQSGRYPRWSGNGKELFYRDGSRMLAVDVTVAGQEPSFSAPRVLFDQRYQFGSAQVSANYDVSADGQRFVMVKDDPAANRLNVIINWSEELKRLAPAGR